VGRFKVTAWLFIAAVTAVDCGFDLHYRDTMAAWEGNPVALALVAAGGLPLAVGCRLATVTVGMAASLLRRTRTALLGTALALAAHAYLAVVYGLFAAHVAWLVTAGYMAS
jgi:hypothetical protein